VSLWLFFPVCPGYVAVIKTIGNIPCSLILVEECLMLLNLAVGALPIIQHPVSGIVQVKAAVLRLNHMKG